MGATLLPGCSSAGRAPSCVLGEDHCGTGPLILCSSEENCRCDLKTDAPHPSSCRTYVSKKDCWFSTKGDQERKTSLPRQWDSLPTLDRFGGNFLCSFNVRPVALLLWYTAAHAFLDFPQRAALKPKALCRFRFTETGFRVKGPRVQRFVLIRVPKFGVVDKSWFWVLVRVCIHLHVYMYIYTHTLYVYICTHIHTNLPVHNHTQTIDT